MKSALVAIAISGASPGRGSSTGRQKVPTPGPYSTNSFVLFQSTGPSMWRISVGDEGTIDPTMTGCLIKPRTNMPHGPKKRFNRSRIRRDVAIFDSWACARGLVMMAFALLRFGMAWQKAGCRARKDMGLTLDSGAPGCRERQVRDGRWQKGEANLSTISRSIPADRMAVLFAIMLEIGRAHV